MPIDCNPIGLAMSLPADAAALAAYGTPLLNDPVEFNDPALIALAARINPIDITQLGIVPDANGHDTFVCHQNPGAPAADRRNSYISMGPAGAPTRYYVKSHIGSGGYGAIAKVSSTEAPGGTEFALKMQTVPYIVDQVSGYDMNTIINIVKEAAVNYILCQQYPLFCNQIHQIGIAPIIAGRRIKIFYLLEILDRTLNEQLGIEAGRAALPADVAAVAGFTVGQTCRGDYFKKSLCRLAPKLQQIYTDLQGNHGDLHAKNIMGDKIIDYGFFRIYYEGVWLETNIYFNSRSSESRDLTILLYDVWRHSDGNNCSIKDTLRPLLNIPNPNPVIYTRFDPWYQADYRIHVNLVEVEHLKDAAEAAAIAAGQTAFEQEERKGAAALERSIPGPSRNTGPLYKFFNAFNNPNVSFAAIRALMCPAVAVAVADADPDPENMNVVVGGRRSVSNKIRRTTRKNADKKRKRRTRQHRRERSR